MNGHYFRRNHTCTHHTDIWYLVFGAEQMCKSWHYSCQLEKADQYSTNMCACSLKSHQGGRCWMCARGICLCFWCIPLCCSAPAEGRTVRPWSAWCVSWDVLGLLDQYFSSLTHSPHCISPTGLTLGYLWYLYGLTRPKQSMGQTYSHCTLPLLRLALYPRWH